MMVPEYNWWRSGKNEPPPHLKTKKQLAEDGMAPLQPVGVIHAKKYDLFLYDPFDPASAKPKALLSDQQKAVLDLARRKQQHKRWLQQHGQRIEDRNAAIEWAKAVLSEADRYVVLDTETTGLVDAEAVEVAVIDLNGAVLLDTLVKPTCSIPSSATAIHGIRTEDVFLAPAFSEIYPSLSDALKQKTIIIYNAPFDSAVLSRCCDLHGFPDLQVKDRAACAMLWYSRFVGDWSSYHRSYRWQPLNGGHRALDDCFACLHLIREMAKEPITGLSFEEWDARVKA